MFRRAYRTRLDRVLAAIEIPALGLWLGALCGFAFIFAPAAFTIVSDLTQFANLTATNLRVLSNVGFVCGGLGIVIAIVRSRDAADRTNDIVRAALLVIALALVGYETLSVIPALVAITDVHSADFAELHQRSTQVYGGVVVLVLASLVMAAARVDT
jgi:hypothetical protein